AGLRGPPRPPPPALAGELASGPGRRRGGLPRPRPRALAGFTGDDPRRERGPPTRRAGRVGRRLRPRPPRRRPDHPAPPRRLPRAALPLRIPRGDRARGGGVVVLPRGGDVQGDPRALARGL